MKKRKLLLLVHVEETFRRYFSDSMYPLRLRRACMLYDEVIHATSHVDDDRPIFEIGDLVTNEIDWGYGYDHEMFQEDERKWVIFSRGHEFTWCPPELRERDFSDVDVYLGGGHHAE